MAKLRPDVKEALVADGRWSAFHKFRTEKVREGFSPVDAMNMAIAEVCPEFGDAAVGGKRGVKPRGGKRALETGRSPESDRADALERIVAAKERLAEMDSSVGAKRRSANGGVNCGAKGDGLVSAEVFAGKPKVSAAEEVLWVAKHLGVEVRAEDAPGELAWNFLMLCRESADFKVKFMLNIASDVVKRRSEEDSGSDGWFDGSDEFDLLGEFAAKLKEVSGGDAVK